MVSRGCQDDLADDLPAAILENEVDAERDDLLFAGQVWPLLAPVIFVSKCTNKLPELSRDLRKTNVSSEPRLTLPHLVEFVDWEADLSKEAHSLPIPSMK